MIPIEIDISPILQAYSQLEGRASELSAFILDRVQDTYMFEWENHINKELKSTRVEYRSAIYVDRVDESNTIIGLTPRESKLALMLENGASSFDIKEGMEKSGKRKEKEDGGWYMTVPFRLATTEALGESSIFSGQLPSEVQESIQEKAISVTTGKSTLKVEDLPSQYQKILNNKVTGYTHKAPIYAGLVRQKVNSTDKESRTTYTTFRRISDKSDEDSWTHPGFEPKKLMDKALNDLQLDFVVSKAIDDFMASI